jgi:transcription initiation factor IIE alpha subunit
MSYYMTCPYCSEDIEENDLYDYWVSTENFSNYFRFRCPLCEEDIEVEALYNPIFILSKEER